MGRDCVISNRTGHRLTARRIARTRCSFPRIGNAGAVASSSQPRAAARYFCPACRSFANHAAPDVREVRLGGGKKYGWELEGTVG